MFQSREPRVPDPGKGDDTLMRLRTYNRYMTRNAILSPTMAFLMGLLFLVFGVWTLLSGAAYLGIALFFLGLGAFFALVTGLMLWQDARRRRERQEQ